VKKRLRWWKWLLIAALSLLIVLTAGSVIAMVYFAPHAKDWVVQLLEEHYKTKVSLDSLDLAAFPELMASGKNLVIQGSGDGQTPFISVESFSARAHIYDLLWNVKRIRKVQLKGLRINVPRHNGDGQHSNSANASGSDLHANYVIDDLTADGTVLRILPKDNGRKPLEFDLEQLHMQTVGVDQPMQYHAVLTNPTPPGQIHTDGVFGPWKVDSLENTPVSGKYTFSDADLSVFRGISGILSSTGEYSGILERINVNGTTDTPDFAVSIARHPVHLTTQFVAIVDGTDGDTYLKPVRAQLGHTVIVCNGAIDQQPGKDGKTVSLEVDIPRGRLEDIMKLAVTNRAPLTGDLTLKAHFVLPPGDRDVVDKLRLNGRFTVAQAHFTEINVQQKISDLSRRGRGDAKDVGMPPDGVVSEMNGALRIADGTIAFSNVAFKVPGAAVDLHGSFGMKDESLAFRGHLMLDVPISHTVTGWKSLVLKAVDPFFRNGKGSSIPIKVGGTRTDPSFGLNLGGGDN
jgi:hypothetical protein